MNPSITLMAAALLTLAACGQRSIKTLPDETMNETEALFTERADAPVSIESITKPVFVKQEEDKVLAKYAHLDPTHIVPDVLLKKLILYYDVNQARFTNKKYMAVIDFSKSSTKKRFFIINAITGEVWAIRTAHGKGSDSNHDGIATRFSNVSGTNASSLGFYRGAETYYGKYGLSLRMDGLSTTNSNARARAIVIHQASYVQEKSVIQGRSWGCPAVAPENRDKVMERLKGGSIILGGLSGVP